ncbi:exodeoxyribonuclease VII large subunit [Flavihumibacter profundi]|uniref:exodeoxyribonuclease VII large subunit n=1 Tax=Flavihumibacter profundi TaxID=2716883 RepID=UPI001CC70A6E|nr:exodeoxyribonuclease VII large subunit [Flavihumibacter profundi]MBZ5857513.1 exodeoxyribonuclease VII large subunit [Flavihumibacter profundi]
MSTPMRLSQLSLLIQDLLGDAFGFQRFWVVAQVSNHSFYGQKGFHYFDLIETEKQSPKGKGSLVAKMAAVAWSAGAAKIRDFESVTGQQFGNDMQVLVEVSVDFHPVYGLKLTLLDIDARFTLGLQEQQRQATIDRLLAECPDYVWKSEGRLQSFNQDLALSPVVQKIAVVSSRTAAGYEDFLHSLNHNPFGYRFSIDPFFTTVQGENNAPALAGIFAEIIRTAEDAGIDYDAVVIIRGGGASTDLLIFDQFSIASVVAACPFPVITGIGHQKNETITDLVAHTALKTPTKVAEFIIQRNRTFENSITGLQQSLIIRAQQYLTGTHQELQVLKSALVYQAQASLFQQHNSLQKIKSIVCRQPFVTLANENAAIKRQQQELVTLNKNYLSRQQLHIDNLLRLFKMTSPEKVLQRGFALIESKGKIISSADKINIGDELTIVLSGTAIESTVHHKKTYDGKPFDL